MNIMANQRCFVALSEIALKSEPNICDVGFYMSKGGQADRQETNCIELLRFSSTQEAVTGTCYEFSSKITGSKSIKLDSRDRQAGSHAGMVGCKATSW